jgi:sugar/nucleoside kinase (ribokinase family)
LNTDLVMTGLPSLPVLGRELVGDGFRIALGSSSAITAARLARLGARVDFAGWLGDDDMGRFVLKELAFYGVGARHIHVTQAGSTGVTIALTFAQDRAFLTYPGLMAAFDGTALTTDVLAGYVHLHVGSFFLQTGLQSKLPAIFRLAHELGLTTSLDSGWDPTETWGRNPQLVPTLAETDIFFPNEDEAGALGGPPSLAAEVRGILVVKQGAQGATAYAKDGTESHAEAVPVTVVDTTGAGDAFNAGFLYATLIEGESLPDALALATACGSESILHVGGPTNAPSADTIRAWRSTRT